MTTTTLNTAKGHQENIDTITLLQDRLTAATGEKGHVTIVDAEGNTLLTKREIIAAIGSTAYDTIASTALASINSTLASTKSTSQTALSAL